MKAKEHLTQAFDLLSTIPVSGANVDVMAQARAQLRQTYAELTKLEKEDKSDGESDSN